MAASVKIGADTSDFQKQMAQVTNNLQRVTSECALASQKAELFGTSTEQLTAKQRLLSETINGSSQKVALYKEKIAALNSDTEKLNNRQNTLTSSIEKANKEYLASVQATGKNSAESKALAKDIANLESEYAKNEKAIARNETELTKAITAMNKEETAILKNKKALADSSNEVEKSIKKTEDSSETLTKNSGMFSKWGLAIASATGIAVTGLLKLATDTLNTASATKKLSAATQLNINDTQEWSYVFNKMGSSTDVMQSSINKLGITMGKADDESKKATAAFQNLGINIADSTGKLRPTGQLFEEAMTKLAGMTDVTERNIIAQRIFGGSYTDLLPILNKGSAGIDELKQRAHELGLVMSDSSVASMATFNKSMKDVKEQFNSIGQKIIAELVPYLGKFSEWLTGNMPKIQEFASKTLAKVSSGIKFISDNANWLVPVLKGLLGVIIGFKVIITITDAIKKYNEVIGVLKATTILQTIAQGGLNAVLIANPIGVVIMAIGALIGIGILLYKNWDVIKAKCSEMWGFIKEKFQAFSTWLGSVFATDWTQKFGILGNIINAYVANFKNIIDGIKEVFHGIVDFIGGVFTGDWNRAWNGVKEIFGGIFNTFIGIAKAPLNGVIGLINMAIDGLNKINVKIPSYIPIYGGKNFGFDIPKIKYLNQGGILDKPTLLGGNTVVGDAWGNGQGANAEAVIPLDSMYKNIDNITKKNIQQQQSNNQPIYVIVNVENNMDSKKLTDMVTTQVQKQITRIQSNRNISKGVV
ncbi:MAG: hypothetical protein Q8936_16760 [Bacillota bacterium]|nr:hypothetical protein [Bacillota bacterium]